jgi:Galactose-3-O-sulfotransferase
MVSWPPVSPPPRDEADARPDEPAAERGDRPTVIFLHIGKTAGTTMRRILRRQYRQSEILLIRNREIRARGGEPGRPNREQTLEYFAGLPERERARPRLIIAHTIFGLHRSVPRPSTYVTLLRDPVSLTISQYFYVARNPRHPLHAELTSRFPTLDAYVRSGVALETDNSQTRAISGDTDTPFGACTEAMLETARSNIERHFAVVGLTERFDQSLMLLRKAFGWTNLYYVRANVTRQDRKDAVSSATRAFIEEQNRLDRELYRWAEERFLRAFEEDPELRASAERFDRLNRLYRPWGHVTYTIPRRVERALRK